MKRLLSFAALLGSLSTIFCCFLPAVFVTLGFGAAFAGLVGSFPQLICLSENKNLIFGLGASLIIVAAIFQWRARYAACPTDPKLAVACAETKGWSKKVLFVAVAFYALGFSFAFILPLFA